VNPFSPKTQMEHYTINPKNPKSLNLKSEILKPNTLNPYSLP